jgi:hypothetical protein
VNGAAHSAILVFPLEATVDRARVAWLRNILERHHAGRDAAEFGAVEIGGQGEKPGGESSFAAPAIKGAVGAEKSLLGHLLGSAAVPAEAIGKIDERDLPAADEAFKCGDVPRKYFLDSSFIVGSAHTAPLPVRRGADGMGCIIFSMESEKNATAGRSSLSHIMRQANCREEDDMSVFLFLSVGAIALFSFVAVAVWSGERRREREAYYRSETLKKIADTQGAGGGSALEFLREEERIEARRKREGQKLGGMITMAVGVGLMIFLYSIPDPDARFAYRVGLIPFLIGVVLLGHALFAAPKE